jgi:hypothetical protein
MESSDEVWKYMMKNFTAGTEINNWTVDKGYLGDTMIIRRVTDGAIEVEAPGAKNMQIILREDFERVIKIWEDYSSKALNRHVVRDMTRYSKYIISILHYYEKIIKHEKNER